MTNEKIITRLQQKGWYIETNTDHERALVFNACLDSGVNWNSGDKSYDFHLNKMIAIGFVKGGTTGLVCAFTRFYVDRFYKPNNENITKWFFDNINAEDV
ncbi:hypothetical protein RCS94_06615 [Orbaceae bacterium ac157xtp]